VNRGPDIAAVAALLGDPARARMLMALMGGRALTASELSLEAGVSPATTSAHLAKLRAARLVEMERQGRHRYFRISDELVAELIEKLCGVAARQGPSERTTGPKDPALRRARVCYDHLAGELGVQLCESVVARQWLRATANGLVLTDAGERHLAGFGIDIPALQRARRPVCRHCLDWSERRHHLAGGLGAALLSKLLAKRWARRDPNTRAIHFSPSGEEKLVRTFLSS
jgi:DNA-binding transcriptional ArsR family regulator